MLIDFTSSSQNGFPDNIDSPSYCAMAAERRATIDEHLSHLPFEYEKVLRLRYWEQLSLEEIAQRMNRSTDAVQKLWFCAVERLKREMNRDERS